MWSRMILMSIGRVTVAFWLFVILAFSLISLWLFVIEPNIPAALAWFDSASQYVVERGSQLWHWLQRQF